MSSVGQLKLRQDVKPDECEGRISLSMDERDSGAGVIIITSSESPTRFVHLYLSKEALLDFYEEVKHKISKSDLR